MAYYIYKLVYTHPFIFLMKQAIESYHSLLQSIQQNTKDFSLLSQLESQLCTLSPSNEDPQVYIRLMLSIYDLSNHPNLLVTSSSPHPQPHSLSINLKLLACHMICIIIEEFMKNGGGGYQMQREIEVEAYEILVVSVSLVLSQEGVKADLGNIWGYVKILAARCGTIDNKIHMLYLLSYLDILRLTITSPNFSLYELQQTLQQCFDLYPKLPEPISTNFLKRIHCISSQLALKLLRQGNKESQQKLKPYLPPQFFMTINRIQEGNLNVENVGDVYQLYTQLSMHGIQGVSLEMLEGVISRPEVFEGGEFFQLVVLVGQPVLLQLWFNQTNRRMQKPSNYPQSFTCLIQLLLPHLQSPTCSNSPCSTPCSTPPPKQHIPILCRLCKQAMLCLIRQPKDSQIQIQIICNYILKFLAQIICDFQMFQICVDVFGNLQLVCTKHSLNQTQKTISILQLYFSLIHHKKNPQLYQKFVKLNNAALTNDKTQQMLRLLKVCAELQLGIKQFNQADMNCIKKYVEFALIFCQKRQRLLLVLEFGVQEISKLGDVFQVYLALFQENYWDDLTTQKIAIHLQKLLLSYQFSKISTKNDSILRLKNFIGRLIQKQNPLYCQLLLYMACFSLNFEGIKSESYGVVLNKYSKLLKMIDLVVLNNEICSIIKILICKQNQKFKKQAISSHGKCSPQAGQLIFLSLLMKKLASSGSYNPHQGSQIFTKFNLFQIYCLNNRNSQLEQITDQQKSVELQQLYINSEFIPQKFKLTLLRKLFRNNLINIEADKNKILSLGEFKQLIMLAQTEDQCAIYVTQVVKIFGEKGRKFVSLLAEQEEKVARVCLQVLNFGSSD